MEPHIWLAHLTAGGIIQHALVADYKIYKAIFQGGTNGTNHLCCTDSK